MCFPTLDKQELEAGTTLAPKFDASGLIPAMAVDAETREPLMFAWMNEEAFRQTIATQKAHFYSRSRKKQWMKGESSGHVLHVSDMRIDCDQDCLYMLCTIGNHGGACHTGYQSCFYRSVPLGEDDPTTLVYNDTQKAFDPSAVYK
ncbi:MAG: phosphoribosyl-AMP cyclohydrolase [Planctomycetota bacterium]